MGINEELKKVYLSRARGMYDNFINLNKTDLKYAGPLLMYCWDEEYEKAKTKILFVGQETNGWNENLPPINDDNILKTIEAYKNFELGMHNKTPFIQALWKLNKLVNKDENRSFLWTNINKFGVSGKGRAVESLLEIEKRHFMVFIDELKICKPDAVIFLCGYRYDSEIENKLGSTQFIKCSEYPERYLSRVSNEYLPYNSYRTYHPAFLRRDGMERIYDIVAEIINGSTRVK
jgi:hypothetical protein